MWTLRSTDREQLKIMMILAKMPRTTVREASVSVLQSLSVEQFLSVDCSLVYTFLWFLTLVDNCRNILT